MRHRSIASQIHANWKGRERGRRAEEMAASFSDRRTRRRRRKAKRERRGRLSTTPELRTHPVFVSLSFSLLLIFTLLFLPPESADSLPALSNLSLCFSLDPCFAGPSLKRSQKTHSCTSYCCFHFSAPPPISFSPPVRAE